MKSTPVQVDDIFGDKLYQERARQALPILVRQANACRDLTYGQLAEELGMPNPRNLNYVLGSIGVTLNSLTKQFGEAIPRIQCLVKNQDTGLPGDGVFEFMFTRNEIASLEPAQKRIAIEAVLAKIFVFQRWNEVLQECGLRPLEPAFLHHLEAARKFRAGGESDEHKNLKVRISKNPALINIPPGFGIGQIEFSLPSGDSVDVVFARKSSWYAVEVKSRISNEADIARGLFQCVKYEAVIKAWQGATSTPVDVIPILALGGALPDSLRALATTLGVTVVAQLS